VSYLVKSTFNDDAYVGVYSLQCLEMLQVRGWGDVFYNLYSIQGRLLMEMYWMGDAF